MTILCLDQATRVTGYSVWSDGKLKLYDVIKVDTKGRPPLERMRLMREGIIDIVNRVHPELVCIEGTQFQSNQKVYGELSQLQGVIFSIFFAMKIPFCIVQPTQWKSFCKIKGKKREEQKRNTQEMVRRDFAIDVSEDIADAIGIGIYAINNFECKEKWDYEKGTEQGCDETNKKDCRNK